MKMTMKWTIFLGVVLLAVQAFGGEPQVLKTQKDKENYCTGIEFVRTLKQQGGAVDLDLVIQGIKDGLTGAKLLMTEVFSAAGDRRGETGDQGGFQGTGSGAESGRPPVPGRRQRQDEATAQLEPELRLPGIYH